MGGKSILLIEDDEGIRELLHEILSRQEGYPVRSIADGQDAFNAAHQDLLPRLIILDMGLPSVSGMAVAHEFRQVYGDGLPILVITADGRHAEKALEAEATECLEKPFDLAVFLETVHRLYHTA